MFFYACGLKSLPTLKQILYRATLVASRIQRVKAKIIKSLDYLRKTACTAIKRNI